MNIQQNSWLVTTGIQKVDSSWCKQSYDRAKEWDDSKPKGRINAESKRIMIETVEKCLQNGMTNHEEIYAYLKSKMILPAIHGHPISFLTLDKYIWTIKKELGIRGKKKIEKINELFDAGLSQKEIAERLNTSVNYARTCLTASGRVKRIIKHKFGEDCKNLNMRLTKESYIKLKVESKKIGISMCQLLGNIIREYEYQ